MTKEGFIFAFLALTLTKNLFLFSYIKPTQMIENGYVQVLLIVAALFIVVRLAKTQAGWSEGLDGLTNTTLQPAASDPVAPAKDSIVGVSSSIPALPGSVTYGAPIAYAPDTPGIALNPPNVAGTAAEQLAVKGTDYEQLFHRQNEICPKDLIPKPDPTLYGDLTPDPGLDQSFLNSAWQAGLSTASTKRRYVQDIRGQTPNPISIVSPWSNPTSWPEPALKSLCDL
jgi:hypothetical protein